MDRILNRSSIFVIMILLLIPYAYVAAQLNSPAEFGAATADTNHIGHTVQPLKPTLVMGSIKLYQRFISPARGLACPMHPSCSDYSSQAFSAHGISGLFLTADRLLRCGQDTQFYSIVRIGRTYRYDDPLIKKYTTE